jgi:hypothetical protein
MEAIRSVHERLDAPIRTRERTAAVMAGSRPLAAPNYRETTSW